jgi:hypothetical protein
MGIRRKDTADAEGVRFDDGLATVRLREVENGAVISRRGVLWRAGLATAAGAATLTALDEQRAAAVSGGNFIIGQENGAETLTTLKATSGITQGFSTLMALDGTAHFTESTLDVAGPDGHTGIHAHLGSGYAVLGSAGSGTGVHGSATSGAGVKGSATTGTGVLATATSGTALNVTGKTKFSRSGAASVAQGHKTETVTVAGMNASSLVLVTLQVSVAGLYLAAAVPALGKFTVHLNKNAPTAVKFAWFALAG